MCIMTKEAAATAAVAKTKKSAKKVVVTAAAVTGDGKKPTGEAAVYVVGFHSHVDCYKCAESSSGVESVHRDRISAHKRCILKNLECNAEGFTLKRVCRTLFDLVDGGGKKKRKKSKEAEEKEAEEAEEEEECMAMLGEEIALEFSTDEIRKALQPLNDAAVVETIYTELLDRLRSCELAMYTLMPTQTLYSVHAATLADAE